jgi:SAM-dependent methyltransferase
MTLRDRLATLLKRGEWSDHDLPIPPLEMRTLVGPTEEAMFDNPDGRLVYADVPEEMYRAVFDFGCGCGRIARQLIQQRPRPERYVGIDLHRGMIEWCRRNLARRAPEFQFKHHNVYNHGFNPDPTLPEILAFPVEDDSFTLAIAHSVFTHTTETQAPHYLHEVARILTPTGVLRSSWFLFDKSEFPMLQEVQNALYISHVDPTAAVIFDREWVQRAAADARLTIFSATPPDIRGYQWVLLMTPARPGIEEVELPRDNAPIGVVDLPTPPPNPSRIGLDR